MTCRKLACWSTHKETSKVCLGRSVGDTKGSSSSNKAEMVLTAEVRCYCFEVRFSAGVADPANGTEALRAVKRCGIKRPARGTTKSLRNPYKTTYRRKLQYTKDTHTPVQTSIIILLYIIPLSAILFLDGTATEQHALQPVAFATGL